jgi:histidinol-phosphatase (PHP family)
MVDCHVHSVFSEDSKINFEEAVQSALNSGISGITFTDHYEFDYPSSKYKLQFDFDKRREAITKLKSKIGDSVKIFEGIELGFQPHILKEIKNLVAQKPWDFVISSVHVVGRADLAEEEYYESKTRNEAIELYLKTIYDSVSLSADFDVVGHIGYICRYMPYKDKSFRYNDYSDLLEMIFKKIIEKGKGIEVNTAGLSERYKEVGAPHPNFDSVKRYLELGGEIITLGSDSHCAARIGADFSLVSKELKNLGAKYDTHFENRKPKFIKLL